MKDLYHILEHEFLPLDVASKIQSLLMKISKLGGKLASASSVPEVQLSQYVPALEKLATLRLLKQVGPCVYFLFIILFYFLYAPLYLLDFLNALLPCFFRCPRYTIQ